MCKTDLISMAEALDIISKTEKISKEGALAKLEELTIIKGGIENALLEIMKTDRNYWLSKHKYKISFNEKEQRWRTYLPPNYKSVAKKSREDLENLIIKFYKKQEAEQKRPDTLEKLYPEFLKFKEQETSLNNARRINIIWNKYIREEPILKVRFEDMTVPDFTLWYVGLVEKHHLNRKRFSDIKSIINMLFDYAIGKGFTKFNISKAVVISYKKLYVTEKKSVERQVYIGDEKPNLVILAMDMYRKTSNMAYLAVAFNVFVGLRVGELVALTKEDVEGSFASVNRQELENIVVKGNGKYEKQGYIISDHTKTQKSKRSVPLSAKAKEIRDYILEEQTRRGIESEYLFVGKNGDRLHAPQIENVMYKKLNPMLGTAQKSNHSLRKGFLSELHNSCKFSDAEIIQWSGHTQISTLQNCYLFPTQPVESRMEEFIDVIDKDMPDIDECTKMY